MRRSALFLVIAAAWLPTPHGELTASAAEPSEIIDLALTPEGALVSRCQDEFEHNIEGATVGLYQQGQLIAESKSRGDGWFTIPGLSAGAYELRSAGWSEPVRLWTHAAAPPEANDPIVLVLEPTSPVRTSDTVRHAVSVSQLRQQPQRAIGDFPAPPAQEDAAFYPFDPRAGLNSTPAEGPAEVAPPQAAVQMAPQPSAETAYGSAPYPAVPYGAMPQQSLPPGLMPGPGPASCCYPTPYGVGPTVGDVVAVTTGITGVTLGAVALYKSNNRDRIIRIVSP